MGNGYCMCTNPQRDPIPASTISLLPQQQQPEYSTDNKQLKPGTITPRKSKVSSPEIKIISLNTSSFEWLLLREINQVRINPPKYAAKLTLMLKYISETQNGCYFAYPDHDMLIIKSGKELFLKTIDYLNTLNPLPILDWNEEIKIIIKDEHIPLTDDKIVNLLIQKRSEVKRKYSLCVFNYDFFPNPELSVIFQITDELFEQKRREAILCPNFRHFAVGYIFDPIKKFVSLLSFA